MYLEFIIINTLLLSIAAHTSRADDESMLSEKFSSSKRIIGGKNATAHEYPFLINIVNGTFYHCSGSILSERWILTAGHCFAKILTDAISGKKSTTRMEVVVGDYSKIVKEANELSIGIRQLVFHPSYSPPIYDSDVVLLYLASPLTYNDDVRPIGLAKTDPQVNHKCLVAGWGRTKANKAGPSQLLKYLAVPVIENQMCKRMGLIYELEFTENMLCAGTLDGFNTTCVGDSGGPLFCAEPTSNIPVYKQYGITSWGPKQCDEKNTATVFVRLSKFVPWIQSVTGLRM